MTSRTIQPITSVALFLLTLQQTRTVAADKQQQLQATKSASAIVNGFDAAPGRHPYTVSVQDIGAHKCGGTLIAPDLVLTAAHCVDEYEDLFKTIVTNPYQISDPLEESETFAIDDIEIHPFRRSINAHDHDYAVVKLSGSSSSPIVRLNTNATFPELNNATIDVVGWGSTIIAPDGVTFLEVADILQQLNATVISNEECTEIFSDQNASPFQITPDMICTTSPEDSGVCKGDSGGPLLVPGDNPSDDIQVGIVSFGHRCSYLEMYARVSDQYNWIRYQVCRMSDNPPESFQCDEGVITFSPAPSLAPTAPTASPAPSSSEQAVLLELSLRAFVYETSWAIQNNEGTEVASTRPGDYQRGAYVHLLYLESGQEFTFILRDTYGDGFSGTATLYLGTQIDEDKILASYSGSSLSSCPWFDYSYEIPFVTDESGITNEICVTQSPSAAPVTSAPTLVRGRHPSCHVCGDEVLVVTEPEAIFSVTNDMSIRCGDLQENGRQGLVSVNYCAMLPDRLNDICGCRAQSV